MRNRNDHFATLLLGGLVIGTLDIAYAILFWTLRGAHAMRIFQSIAAGLLGKASFDGGLGTAILGALLHYFIATSIVVVYWLASRRLPVLIRHPHALGALYGLGVYAFMNYVVIPLSRANRPKFLLSWVVCSIAVHALLIGVPAALFARRAIHDQ
jgi:hypothetical protein